MDNSIEESKLKEVIVNTLSGLSLIDKLEVIANVLLILSISNLAEKGDKLPSNWDEAFLFITSKSKEKGESLGSAIGKQALTINLWIQEEYKRLRR